MTDAPARPEAPIRVAVVDDSALMRRLLTAALEDAPDIAVVGAARDAAEARDLIRSADPDVVTLDVAMPGMSGIDFLRKIMELRPTPVVMVSNLTAEGADLSVTALQIGAIDVVQKPQGPAERDAFAATLQAKVRIAASARAMLARRTPARERPSPPGGRAACSAEPARQERAPAQMRGAPTRQLVAIGASTGGVRALSRLLRDLPEDIPPVVIVQHMPKDYPERFASRLRMELKRDVAEARTGEALISGAVRIAPGDRHMRIVNGPRGMSAVLEEGAPVSGHCPSVDVLFESVARSLGGRAVGVILTGMGRDGAMGLAAMRRAGAACIGQDRETSVVWGMPRAALELGALDEEAPLDRVAARICHHLHQPLRERRTKP